MPCLNRVFPRAFMVLCCAFVVGALSQVAIAQSDDEPVADEWAEPYAFAGTPDWTVRAGGLFLSTGHLKHTLLLTRGNLTPVLYADAIDMGSGTGWELAADKRLTDEWTVGARYFAIDSFSDQVSATNVVNGAGVRFRNTVLGVLGAVNATYDLNYGANLSSIDVTARRQWNDWLQFSGGFRQVQFNDQLNSVFTGGGFTTRVNLGATNQLTGAQLGADVLLWNRDRLELLALGNAGVYGNDSKLLIATRTNIPRSSSFGATRTSFVGEFELKGRYRLNDTISFEAGYRLLWLEGIALANEQAAINRTPPNAADAIANSDGLFLHGVTGSLVVQF